MKGKCPTCNEVVEDCKLYSGPGSGVVVMAYHEDSDGEYCSNSGCIGYTCN
jgi:hypothetical protein